MLMTQMELHTVVALTSDLPAHGLIRGQVGTIVEIWAPDVYEVEFSDDDGRAYALASRCVLGPACLGGAPSACKRKCASLHWREVS